MRCRWSARAPGQCRPVCSQRLQAQTPKETKGVFIESVRDAEFGKSDVHLLERGFQEGIDFLLVCRQPQPYPDTVTELPHLPMVLLWLFCAVYPAQGIFELVEMKKHGTVTNEFARADGFADSYFHR